MKNPFSFFIKSNNKKEVSSNINTDRFNILYDSLTRYLGKGQVIWNKNDLKYIVESGYLFNPDTYSIINKIIQTASSIQFKLYEVKDEKSFKEYKNIKSLNLEKTYSLRTKAFEPIEQPEIFKLLEAPNKLTTHTLFIQSILGYYCLLGNSYLNKLTITGNADACAASLEVLPAYMVKIILGDSINPIKSYTIENFYDKSFNIPPENVYHFKTFNPSVEQGQFLYGAPPSIYPTLTKSNDSYEASCSLIQNLGAIGILSSGNDDTIDPVTTEKMEQKYLERFGGAKNRGKVWMVGHKMDWQSLSQSIVDLDLIQGQEQDFLTLCRIFNVDSRIMGYVKGSTFSNMAEARKDFLQNRILPLMYMITEGLNKFIIPAFSEKDRKNYYLDIDTDIIPELQEDMNALSLRLQNEIKCGLITPYDASRMLGYPELTDEASKKLYMQSGIVPLSNENNLTNI